LESLWKQIMEMGGCWLIDADIRKFFDTLVKEYLRSFLRRRVRDGVIERLVGKWLKAGVLEDGQISYPEDGTPQGGVISPLLSNIYLHEVLDEWFETQIKPRLKGRAFLIRYADDFVMGFEVEQDARRVLEVLAKRFARFGLEIHPEKTRLVDFTRPREHASVQTTFDFLGFTHYWGKSRKGRMVVQRKTAGSRLSRAFKKVEEWCKAERHQPVAAQWKTLRMKLQGHYGYYGITGNFRCLRQFWRGVIRRWHFWLNRRSRRRDMLWRRFAPLLARYPLPPPRIVHSSYTPRAANP
jgi:group II intron reverse transcriptase/maturase